MFYIYEKQSTYIIGKPDRNGVARPDHRQCYKTMPAAETEYFHSKIEKQVKKKNMMNGKEFFETANTPYYCSPSSETYWSM
mgnify:CR=1 FL=1